MHGSGEPSPEVRLGVLPWGLGFSLALHACLLLLNISPWHRQSLTLSPNELIPIEVAEVPPEALQARPEKKTQIKKVDPREKQIAESEDAKNREVDPEAKYLSDKNQKAELETKAQAIDDFRKKQGSGAKQEKTAETESTTARSDEDEQGVGIGGMASLKPGPQAKRDWRQLSLKDLGVGGDGGSLAATDDKLDGVQGGERTILSTREFRYFSYYHRIKELLRQYWKPNVERKLARVWSRGRTISEDELTTKVLVLLDEQGSIQKISRVGSSGIDELDEAAVEAFNRAGPFPNPPKGIVDADGFVRIRWDFILKTETGPRIQFRTAGPQHNPP